MEITHYKVYDLPEAVVASGFPMISDYDPETFETQVLSITDIEHDPHLQRAVKLAAAKDGSGHRTFLAGILVAMNVTATVKWWIQFGRYHFQQIDSSMSTMHRLKKMSQLGTIRFHEKTDKRAIELIDKLIEEGADDETIIYSCPGGLELTARVNTNYLQLRTIYIQRKHHKLEEWHDFCDWIEILPYSKQFITLGAGNESSN